MTRRTTPLFACIALAIAVAFGAAPAVGQTSSGDVSPSAAQGLPEPDPAASAFWTKYAYFVPSQFSDLPGWRDDDVREAWKAFRQTCNVLGSRSAWLATCSRSGSVRANDSDDIRRFIEREFALYQIHNKDRSVDGVITGYYEPLLNGSRRPGQGYVYPVYGIPDNLLFLDSRNIPDVTDGSPIFARIEGRNVIPACPDKIVRVSCIGPYKLDLGDVKPDIRDKKMRVRIEGDRVVPYFTRIQIEQGALGSAQALLWVNDVSALYSMQVQGSGKIRLQDGQIVRLAYGEQNGHPFTPPVRASRKKSGGMLTRGIALPDDDDDAPDAVSNALAPPQPLTRGTRPSTDPERPAVVAPKPAGDEALSPEVARMVDMLLKGTGSTAQPVLAPSASPQPQVPQKPPQPQPQQQAAIRPAPAAAAPVSSAVAPSATSYQPVFATSVYSSDPSYVFFRQIPDSEQGPVGALGVPLTAGRSIAVDPRTTPLGFPVFIATGGQAAQLNRLMLAQDTGGAIRGPVRADYFWGFGPSAGELASRMKENGRMWLLMPKGLSVTMSTGTFITRGLSRGAGPNDTECLVPDPDFCVE